MIARVAAVFFALACFASEPAPNQLYGTWKVTAVTGASPITAISGATAARLVGRSLVLGPHKIQFAGRICQTTYDVSNETSDEFVQDYKIAPKIVGLDEPVTRFDAGCTDIFLHATRKIIFTWKGYFLEATKISAK